MKIRKSYMRSAACDAPYSPVIKYELSGISINFNIHIHAYILGEKDLVPNAIHMLYVACSISYELFRKKIVLVAHCILDDGISIYYMFTIYMDGYVADTYWFNSLEDRREPFVQAQFFIDDERALAYCMFSLERFLYFIHPPCASYSWRNW